MTVDAPTYLPTPPDQTILDVHTGLVSWRREGYVFAVEVDPKTHESTGKLAMFTQNPVIPPAMQEFVKGQVEAIKLYVPLLMDVPLQDLDECYVRLQWGRSQREEWIKAELTRG